MAAFRWTGALCVPLLLAAGQAAALGDIRAAGPTEFFADVQLSATALVMSGTNETLSIPPATPEYIATYVAEKYRDYVNPSGFCVGGDPGCLLTAVYTPEQMRPFTGLTDMTFDESVAVGQANLDACIRGAACMLTAPPYTDTNEMALTDTVYVASGMSQSAVIASYQKAALISDPVPDTTVSFILVSSPNRPNGGLLERFAGLYIPFVGLTFNGATPTDSARSNPLLTIDVVRQYDGWADFPNNPLNLLADLNAALGALFLHPAHNDLNGTAVLQGYYQDTTYYITPSELLPLVMPLDALPLIGPVLARLLDAPLRVLVETGYDRTINPGQPTRANFFYFPNPIHTLVNFAVAIPTGVDDAIAYITKDPANRPFHTLPQGAYGVGGPPIYAGAIDPYVPPDVPPVAISPTPAVSAAVSTSRVTAVPPAVESVVSPAAAAEITAVKARPTEFRRALREPQQRSAHPDAAASKPAAARVTTGAGRR